MLWHLGVGVQRKTMGTGTAGACECEEVPCITTARSHTTNCLSGPLEGDAPFDGGSHGTCELGLVSPTSPLKAYYTGQRGPAPHGVPGEAATDARPLLEKTLGRDIWMPQSGSLCPMGGLRLRRSARRAERAAGGLAAPQALVRLGGSSRWCRMGDRVARAVGGKGRLTFLYPPWTSRQSPRLCLLVVQRSPPHAADCSMKAKREHLTPTGARSLLGVPVHELPWRGGPPR